MPKFHGLEGSTREEREEFSEEVKEREPRVKPRLTFPFPLSKEREAAIDLVNCENPDPEMVLMAMESQDRVVSRVGLGMAVTMENMGEAQLSRIAHILELVILDPNRDFFERSSAVSNLRVVPDYALRRLPIIIGNLPEKEKDWITVQCRNMLEYFQAEERGEIALIPYSEELDEKNDGEVTDDPEPITTRKPLFATPYKNILAQRLEGINLAAKLLGFIDASSVGFIVNGSMAKGYMGPKSDIDLALVHRHETEPVALIKTLLKELANRCLGKLTGAEVCKQGIKSVAVNRDNVVMDFEDRSRLFGGLFCGDSVELTEIQYATLLGMTDSEWDRLRIAIYRNEIANIPKARARFYPTSTVSDVKKAMRLIILNRVPPPYEETKALLEKRMRKIEAKK